VTDAVGPGEAARQLGVSTRTVQRWLRNGQLASVTVGGRLKVASWALAKGAFTPAGRPIERLLVANRGELVVRIARTCRRLGVRCLGLVAADQARAWWTSAVDELVPLAGGYLDPAAVIEAARQAGADAVHPGYGFLAENADFAAAVVASELRWVGPPAAAMRALGDKQRARQLAAASGVPIVPGYDGDAQSDRALRQAAEAVGYPLLIKPSAGGGGKGMHVVSEPGQLAASLATARREARAAFGDDRLILERYLGRARHVEIQLLCDSAGEAVYLGERDCSLQRRHQKVVEEAPSPAVDGELRGQLGAAAILLARAAGYVGAGTAEFLLDERGNFYFLELNARLQVEHPLTEAISGRDLVADQLRIAAGEPLAFDQAAVELHGHAVEARLYAEEAEHDFLPSIGEVVDARWPTGDGVRVDAGVGAGDVVGTRYDPLLAKLIAWAEDRPSALARLDAALAATSVLGVSNNRGFLRWLISRPDVAAGATDTELIEREWQPAAGELPAGAWPAASAALAVLHAADRPRLGFRLNAAPRLNVEIGAEVRSLPIAGPTGVAWAASSDGTGVVLDLDGRSLVARLAAAPTAEAALRHAAHAGAGDAVRAPMPGAVLELRVATGDTVDAGETLLVLEAMKMENAVSAPAAGRVSAVLVAVGQQVQRGEALLELA
jgi:excisionase family DNA binding protein